MSELLSPAGTIESFYAAISNGANAIYLGLDRFSARAYANNFSLESLETLIPFAHLRNVKVYITINTIIYDDELDDVFATINKLAELGVDGVIVQDLAVANYIISNFESLHAHASTQIGCDDLQTATLLKEMGFKRIVFARETPLQTIKEIKNKLNIEVEEFIHGALCVSYSGNCYMSSAIGERSGNRGRCAGCCRKFYSLTNTTLNETISSGYLLSMKDLNVSSKISNMDFIDSFKIEGRMKEPSYVAGVTRIYRQILDNSNVNENNLNKVFNRTYTNGFMNGETSSNITNIERPNNYGYYIGNVIKQNKNTIWIRLISPLNKGDQIRIEAEHLRDEISVPIISLYDANFTKVDTCNKVAICSCAAKVKIGAKVYKTKDNQFIKNIENTYLDKEYNKLPLNIEFTAHVGKPIFLRISYLQYKTIVKSHFIVEESITSPITKENIIAQFNKLNDTPYCINNMTIDIDSNIFIPLKQINELRRDAINQLNLLRLSHKKVLKEAQPILPEKHSFVSPQICVEVSNEAQYQEAVNLGIEHIYYKNIVPRNNSAYPNMENEVLVNGLGGVKYYKGKAKIITDSSLNVVNHISAAILSSLGAERITISQEICKEKIIALINQYQEAYCTAPNLELIVYGRSKIMHSKYCPLKRVGLCGKCKESSYALKDDFASFPLMFNSDCTTTLLNSKPLNIMDDIYDLTGINYYRLVFTTETIQEMKELIADFSHNLKSKSKKSLFNSKLHTRGHFINNPL